jgi:hypothetical protein
MALAPKALTLQAGSGTPGYDPEPVSIVGVLAKNAVAFQAATTAADLAALKVDFNALLTKLRAADVMAES